MVQGAGGKQKAIRVSRALHRDLGYLFLGLIIVYCVSGIALNHVDDWNPDFIIEKKKLQISRPPGNAKPGEEQIREWGKLVGELSYKTYDYPTNDQLKIYYDNASLHIDLAGGTAHYEKLRKRHVFYQVNVLHRNSLKQWKWISDIFGAALVIIALTGLMIPQGKKGPLRSGKWYILAGFAIPAMGIFLFYILT